MTAVLPKPGLPRSPGAVTARSVSSKLCMQRGFHAKSQMASRPIRMKLSRQPKSSRADADSANMGTVLPIPPNANASLQPWYVQDITLI